MRWPNSRSVLGLLCLACAAAVGVGSGRLPQGEARRITPAELRQALAKNRAILIDVRSRDSYKAGHIRGARSIPFDQILNRAGELPHDKMIVTYCS